MCQHTSLGRSLSSREGLHQSILASTAAEVQSPESSEKADQVIDIEHFSIQFQLRQSIDKQETEVDLDLAVFIGTFSQSQGEHLM